MSGAAAGQELPPPVRYEVEPGDLAIVRARQARALKRDMAPVVSNLIPIAVGLAYAGVAYLIFKAVVPRPVPVAVAFLTCLAVFGVSVGGLAQWAITMWNSRRALNRLDRRIATSAAGGEAVATLEESGFQIFSRSGAGARCAYAAIDRMERDAGGLFLHVSDDLILHVPARAFPDEATISGWVAAVERRIGPRVDRETQSRAAAPAETRSSLSDH